MNISLPVLDVNKDVKDRLRRVDKAVRGCKEAAENSSGKLLTPGNTKLGPAIWHFSLPPGSTCPTMTPSCATHCYAIRYVLRFPKINERYVRSYYASLRDDFVKRVRAEIKRNAVSILRLHASGEFYNESYARKWLDIARSERSTKFFFYTRAWRDPALRKVILELSKLSNVFVWFSCDKDSGIPKRLKSVRIAYMAIDNNDVPAVPVDLVFKVRDRSVKTVRLGGSLVCPVENGTEAGKAIDCTTCRLCYKTAWLRDFRQPV